MRVGVCVGLALLTAAPLSAQEANAPFDLAKLSEKPSTEPLALALDAELDCDAPETDDDAIVVCGKQDGEEEFKTGSQAYDKGDWAGAEPAKPDPLKPADQLCMSVGLGGCVGRLPVRWMSIGGAPVGKVDAETEALIKRQTPVR